MPPNTRNSVVCSGCQSTVARYGEGEDEGGIEDLKCQKCWKLTVVSLQERILELESSKVEQDEFQDVCTECNNVKAENYELNEKVKKLEKSLMEFKNKEGEVEELLEELKRRIQKLKAEAESQKEVLRILNEEKDELQIKLIRTKSEYDNLKAQIFEESQVIGGEDRSSVNSHSRGARGGSTRGNYVTRGRMSSQSSGNNNDDNPYSNWQKATSS